MIYNYWAFVEGLLACRRQRIFIFFAISVFLDIICDLVVSIEKWTETNINPAWLIAMTTVSIILFIAFCSKYALEKTEAFKYKSIYLSILITLCSLSVLLYLVYIINSQICAIEIPVCVYGLYAFVRLIFIIHIRCNSKKQ